MCVWYSYTLNRHFFDKKKTFKGGLAKCPTNIFSILKDILFLGDVSIWTWTLFLACGCAVESAWVQYMLFFLINWASKYIEYDGYDGADLLVWRLVLS